MWPNLRRAQGVTFVEFPGFGRPKLGALLYAACAAPLGIYWGIRARAFLSIQLMSTSLVAAVCSRVTRTPLTAMSTTSGELGEMKYLLGTRSFAFRRWLLGCVSSLVAQTPEVARELGSLIEPGRVVVIPNPMPRIDAWPKLSGKPRVMYAGRLSEEKNLNRLLDAWAAVAPSREGASLTLVGSGGSYRSVESELRARVAETPLLKATVAMPGWVPDVSPYYEQHDVFVLPSLEEGMSNALLEACAWRRVIVASDIPANRAVLGADYPLLFDPTSSESLAAALAAALTRDDVTNEAASDRVARVSDRHSPTRVYDELQELLDAACDPRD